MHRKRTFFLLLFVMMTIFNHYLTAQEVKDTGSYYEKSVTDRIKDHDFPSIARPWGFCIDFTENDRSEEISRHDISWESIGRENSKVGTRVAGANWTGRYNALGTSFSNVKESLERRRKMLSLNPNMLILAELRWRDYTDSSLPVDHEFWKRDRNGDRIPASGDKMNEPRYYLDIDNPKLTEHLCQQAKCMVESGVFDGVFLDWYGPSASFLKKLREALGPTHLIIINANYKYDPERAMYINGAYMECYKTNNPESLPLWEKTVCAPKINVVDMMGEEVNCTGEPDLKRMRNTTTFSLIHSNGYVLYGDHYHKHRWFSFWNTKLGEPKGEKSKLMQGAFKREFTNGVVVNNSGDKPLTIKFDALKKRASNNTTGRSFTIESGDGDFFINAN
jgi:hypothetical protein